MRTVTLSVLCLLVALPLCAQSPAPPNPLPATDVTGAAIQAFLNALPRDRVSDSPIRVVDVGGYKVGAYGVYRPQGARGNALVHRTKMTEIYVMLSGSATLVTGGALAPPIRETRGGMQADSIQGGVTRPMTPGDVVIIPGGTPHWWSSRDTDITYLIFRPDPEGQQTLK